MQKRTKTQTKSQRDSAIKQNSLLGAKSSLTLSQLLLPASPLVITTLLFVAAFLYFQGDGAGWVWLFLFPVFILMYLVSALITIVWCVFLLRRSRSDGKVKSPLKKQALVHKPETNPGEFLGIIGIVASIFLPVISIIMCAQAIMQSRRAGYGNPLAWVGVTINLAYFFGTVFFVIYLFVS